MFNFQLSSGFVIPSLITKLRKWAATDDEISTLLKKLSTFEVISNVDIGKEQKNGVELFYVLHNQIVRGEPTFLFLDMEKEFARKVGYLEEKEMYGELDHVFTGNNQLVEHCWKALHYIDPRINRHNAKLEYLASWERLDSHCEENFIYCEIPDKLFQGEGDFLIQLFQPQRSLDSMIEDIKVRKRLNQLFKDQRADFVLEFPYVSKENEKRGICLEVDGPHHLQADQKDLDRLRDNATLDAGWHPTVRFPVHSFGDISHRQKFAQVQRLLENDAIRVLKANFDQPLYNSAEGRAALQLSLSPFAIARVQLVILKAIISGILTLDTKEWNIGILEQDVPCGHLAVDGLKEMFGHLTMLENKGMKLPEINLQVFCTPEFKDFELNSELPVSTIDNYQHEGKSFDMVVDVSVLKRAGFNVSDRPLNAKSYITIRSSHTIGQRTPFLCGERIKYRSLVEYGTKKPIPEAENAITFFLRNIFRKKEFRVGQLPILHYAMKNETVIGLLPTGGGKSLTYQIAGLLQPGIVLIVDPIKSLMKDQVDGLHKVGITRTVFINSSLKTYEDRKQAYHQMKSGTVQYCFVSPERLQMREFRNYLQEMYEEGKFFTYAVIDEVHCVSEWGHDFRTSYLSLGENLLRYCKPKSGKISLFGLTATASFDVLADVQRELSGTQSKAEIPDENIVRHETTNRDEIQYIVDPIEITEEEIKEIANDSTADNFEMKLKALLGVKKQIRTNQWIGIVSEKLAAFNNNPETIVNSDLIQLTYDTDKLPDVNQVFNKIKLPQERLNNFWNTNGLESNAGLVFTPHRSWYFGVTDKYSKPERGAGVYDFLQECNPHLRFGTYIGTSDDLDVTTSHIIEEDNSRNQDEFQANKINVMVATKAFGMGIDKRNIRFVIHISYPGSIESYIQEAGRCGRDGKLAVGIILFNKQEFINPHDRNKFKPDFDIQQFFHFNSFKGPYKEKAVLYELLTTVQHPPKTNADNLGILLVQRVGDYGEDVVFKIRFSPKYNYLWLNDQDGNTYGNINLNDNSIDTSKATVPVDIAENCLEHLLSLFQEHVPPGLNSAYLQNWFNQKYSNIRQPGIETLLEEKEIGDTFTMTIPFENDQDKVISTVTEYCQLLDKCISSWVVNKYFDFQVNVFLKNLGSHYKWADWEEKVSEAAQKLGIESKQFLERLAFRIGGKRNKVDTEKALYRLSLIGVIDEYTVDFRTKTFELSITKKTEEEYYEHLRYYLGKFYAKRKVEAIIEGIPNRKGETAIQRILNFLIEFIYEEIARKRYMSIHAMEELCTIGQEQGNIEMKSFIHLYFNSKYARKGYSLTLDEETVSTYRCLRYHNTGDDTYNISLLDWSEEGKQAEIDWVFDFMQLMLDDYNNSQIDNLKHLRGACTRLLILNPDNFSFRLLRAYSNIMLSERRPESQLNMLPVFEDLRIGFEHYANTVSSRRSLFSAITACEEAIILQIDESNEGMINAVRELFQNIAFLFHTVFAKSFSNTISNQLKPLFT
ncbi:MAG: hypothetical protein KatS3mg031_3068 [Chitinophagales bacterium]|nr:MAG: hypothetical protein KatS3mg031_3068 [Chitinophagales bacterium]